MVIYFENKEKEIKEQKEDESEARLIHIKKRRRDSTRILVGVITR